MYFSPKLILYSCRLREVITGGMKNFVIEINALGDLYDTEKQRKHWVNDTSIIHRPGNKTKKNEYTADAIKKRY